MPPLAQDAVALARIDANEPVVPYPLLSQERQEASVLRLTVYLFQLVVWRWRTRHQRRAERWYVRPPLKPPTK